VAVPDLEFQASSEAINKRRLSNPITPNRWVGKTDLKMRAKTATVSGIPPYLNLAIPGEMMAQAPASKQ